jgi:hypothetical protein
VIGTLPTHPDLANPVPPVVFARRSKHLGMPACATTGLL